MAKTTTHKEVASMATAPHIGIRGFVSSEFETMRVAFLENFFRRRALGAACCVYRKGEKVVGLTGRY
jgi:hypothetical protein